MDASLVRVLRARAYRLRIDCLRGLAKAGSGHVTSCFSAADIVAVLFGSCMRFNPHEYACIHNDRFILSKGHAAPLLYAIWKEIGLVSEEEWEAIRTWHSRLEGHPTPRFPYAEGATGSLGQGLALAAGQAYAIKHARSQAQVYVLLGDSEFSEGSNWEACEWIALNGLTHVTAIIDFNQLGQTGAPPFAQDVHHRVRQLEAFGWDVHVVDGHDIYAVNECITASLRTRTKPVAVIARTQKGHGLPDDIAGRNGFHGRAFSRDELPRLETYLADMYYDVAQDDIPTLVPHAVSSCKPSKHTALVKVGTPPRENNTRTYAPRKAVAQALATYAREDVRIVCVDAEVKNSTYTELVEAVAPERFLQAGVAEQLMVGIASGACQRGMQAWIATFASFLTRAADQLRMSAIGRVPLRVIGTHVGVSIGADGPSQMGLEDIALFAALPHARIFYPADYYASYAAVRCAYEYDDGISYIRTTRGELPVIYDQATTFEWGGCHVLRQHTDDCITVVAAGVTVAQALAAYDILKKQGVSIRVIDAYSVLPLPDHLLCAHAAETHGRILVVEDHYIHGGLGSLVAQACAPHGIRVVCAGVRDVPRSGNAQDLFAWAGISAEAIAQCVHTYAQR